MTRLLMTLSAAFLALLGVAASFMPQEIASYAGSDASVFTVALCQLAGAAWVAFALVNWTARGNMIGGIYARPVALGNFAHFTIAAVALLKLPPVAGGGLLVGVTVGYCVFAAWFGYVLFFGGPRPASASS